MQQKRAIRSGLHGLVTRGTILNPPPGLKNILTAPDNLPESTNHHIQHSHVFPSTGYVISKRRQSGTISRFNCSVSDLDPFRGVQPRHAHRAPPTCWPGKKKHIGDTRTPKKTPRTKTPSKNKKRPKVYNR